jgi:methyl-CpG-binding domain protein 4
VIWRLFDLCPTPQAAAAADEAAVRELIRPLGLFNKRAAAVLRFSQEYLRDGVRAWGGVGRGA